jgi:hypothetical protein
MTLEKELLDFTNWLVDNKWTLVGNGLCLNNDTKKLASIGELVRQSNSLEYYEQDFQVGDIVKDKEGKELCNCLSLTMASDIYIANHGASFFAIDTNGIKKVLK